MAITASPISSVLTSGDPVYLTRTIYEDGVALSLTGYTIRAAFQNGQGLALTSAVAQVSSTAGAVWASGVLAIAMTAAQAAGLSRGDAYLEIELTSPAGLVRTLPLARCEVQSGVIA